MSDTCLYDVQGDGVIIDNVRRLFVHDYVASLATSQSQAVKLEVINIMVAAAIKPTAFQHQGSGLMMSLDDP